MKTEKQNKIIEPYAIRDINWEKQNQICDNCYYYESDFNGRECCAYETLVHSGCLEQLPKERTCKEFKPIQSPSEETSLSNSSGASEGVHSQEISSQPRADGLKTVANSEDGGIIEPPCSSPDTSNNSTMKAKDFSKAIDKSNLRGYQFEDNSTLKQVEELEKDFELNNLDCDKEILADLINRAKLLKAEIEKGCGKDIPTGIPPRIWDCTRPCGTDPKQLCPKCLNLIERLNKIIGEKE